MPKENEGESLLDAINAAIPSGDAPEQDTPEVDEPEGDEPEGDAPEGDEAEGDAPEGDEPEGDAPEGDEAEGEEGDEDEPAAEAKKPAKEADPVNDPLPKGTLESTQKRFTHVVEKLKEQTTRAEAAETSYNEIISEITDAGMDGNTFGHMLEYARGVNSGTETGMRKAYAILQSEIKGLAEALGETLPGQNPLAGHDDLIKEVDAKTITPQRAIEIAQQRNRTAASAKLSQHQNNSQQSAAQQKAASDQGRADLTALGKELAAKDGPAEYRRKAALVVGMLKETLPNLSPKLWAKAFRSAYAQVPAAAPKAAAAKPGAKPQPLRGNKVPSGNSAKSPKTLLDAIGPAFE